MSTIDSFISTFSRLGDFLHQFAEDSTPGENSLNQLFAAELEELISNLHIQNPWFTPANITQSLGGIADMLESGVLSKWLNAYDLSARTASQTRTIGLVLAGNIPLVGFHDILSVLAAGHTVLAKPSSKDDRLVKLLARILLHINPEYGSRIRFTSEYLKDVDAVIATGSDNSSRYFEYYFRNIPHIIRKNRNGVAVLTGDESEKDLLALGKDIFTYFGLGCRNVTKLYIPDNYDLTRLLKVLDQFQDLYQHHKYGNNVDYYRTIYLMNKIQILDNGVLLLKEDTAIASPVGVVFYERYSEIGYVQNELENRGEEIQCCVSIHPEINTAISPGLTQRPMPWDYADGVDTITFLNETL